MAKDQKVYMPLMIGDWLKGTRGMRAEVRGVYINLLLFQWDNGFIPSDMDELFLIDPEVGKVWDKLKEKFQPAGPGKLQNKKNEEVRAFWSKQKDNGKLGGRPPGSGKTKYISQEKMDWEEMISFFDNSCVCCGYKFPEDNRPTKDHIMPQISGGSDDISNLQPLCRQCNSSKHATHTTDYRLKFISKIPKDLRDKWFKENPELTQTEPKHKTNHNHHNDLDLDLDSDIELKLKGAFDEIYLDQQKIKWPHLDFLFEFRAFCEKVRGSPGHYAKHDTEGLRLALQSQLRNAKKNGTAKNKREQNSSELREAFAKSIVQEFGDGGLHGSG